MVGKFKQASGILLLVIYTMFFVSANLCYHSHQLADGTVVHSHLFFGGQKHSHDVAQLQMIDMLDSAVYEEEVSFQVQIILPECGSLFVVREVSKVVLIPSYLFLLRAPPVA